MDDAHLYRGIRYVENNPVRAKITKQPWQYEWSSCPDHTGERENPLIKISNYKTVKKEGWKEYLKEDDPDGVNEIRLKTQRGLVAGTDKFIKKFQNLWKMRIYEL